MNSRSRQYESVSAAADGICFVCATQSKSCHAFSTMAVMLSPFERFFSEVEA